MSSRRLSFFVGVALLLVAVAGAAVGLGTADEVRDDGVVPVILVHGYGGDAAMVAASS